MSNNSSSQATCYLGNGGIAPDAVQCDPTGTINTCCPQGFVCLSNGMCFGNTTTGDYFKYTRDACVDPSGRNCLPHCASDEYNNGAGDSICGNQFTGFCCFEDHASGACNCDTGENAFTLPYGTPVSTIGSLDPTDVAALAMSMSTISSLLEKGITEGRLPTLASSLISTGSTMSSSSSRSLSPSASNAGSLATQSAQSSSHLDTGAKVGLGVGISLLFAMLAVAGFMVFHFRRRALIRGATHTIEYEKPELPTEGSEVRRWRSPLLEIDGNPRPKFLQAAIELPTSK